MRCTTLMIFWRTIPSLILIIVGYVVAWSGDKVDSKGSGDVFVATKEFQIVNESQALPPGLHIRVNLETGEKEAKLLDDFDNADGSISGSRMSVELMPIEEEEEEKEESETKTYESLQDALNSGGSKMSDEQYQEKISRFYTNQYEMVSGMSELLDLHSHLKKLHLEYSKMNMTSASSSWLERVKMVLLKAKDLVDHVDLGAYWVSSGGFNLTLDLLQRVPDVEIKAECASLLGITLQSNELALSKLSDRQAIFGILMDLLLSTTTVNTSIGKFLWWKTRVLHPISSLVLLSPDRHKLQKVLLEDPHQHTLQTVFQETGSIRILNLLFDLSSQASAGDHAALFRKRLIEILVSGVMAKKLDTMNAMEIEGIREIVGSLTESGSVQETPQSTASYLGEFFQELLARIP